MSDNHHRRSLARIAVEAASEDFAADPRSGIVDTLTNIRHLCESIGVDFDTCVQTSAMHYEEETDTHLNVCSDCGARVPEIIGCPDGAEICHPCFESGAH